MQAASVVFKHSIRVLHGYFLPEVSLLFMFPLYANISAQSRAFLGLRKIFFDQIMTKR
nr:MAG TPA: hypothetical protein [Bacteriophage sp.]